MKRYISIITLIAITSTKVIKIDALPTNPNADLNWWKSTPIYQIYPRSFQDSDGDGTGDLKGITQRVEYLHDLGIKAIWLSPIYASPMADFGYDISNFTDVDPIFGTLADFQELLDKVHSYGMYLIMDFVPNHSSNEHDWFKRSVKREDPYTDYYVWKDKPNNWLSAFGNSSWEYDETRKQYYLHEFLMEQPDLNYRNPALRAEMLNVLKVWIDRGVDGFRVDAVVYLVEDDQFRDEPKSGHDVPPNSHDYLTHIYTQDLNETYDVVQEWTSMLKEYEAKMNRHIFTCTEVFSDVPHDMRYYSIGVDFPFNFNLIPMDSKSNATSIRKMINSWLDNMPAGAWPNWVLSNHDQHRVASRLGGREYIDLANMLLLLLPGTPTCYYGDEIGMINANISYEDSVDPLGCNWGPDAYMNFSRDPERTPMQWDKQKNAGFSTASKTWLPMGSDYQKYNVEEESKDANSHLAIFKSLVKLRQEKAFLAATNLRLLDIPDENVLAFTRELATDQRYLIVLNFGHDGRESLIEAGLATGTGEVVIRSANGDSQLTKIDFSHPFKISNAQGYVIKLL